MALTAPVGFCLKAGAAPRLLHVTDAFPFTGDRNSPAMIAACQRGHIVHKICEDYDRGLPMITEPIYAGYLVAWQQCLAVHGATPVEIEMPIGGEKLGFIGRLDRVMAIKKELWIWDIKSGAPWPTHGPQTAAYEYGYREAAGIDRKKKIYRACVHLKSDGTFQMKHHKSVHDLNVFLAYLRIAKFEIECGLRESPGERE